ncbi:MAG: threonine-phosphate decarboxylase CobD [Porticoccaceae bacterium]
MALIHGGNLIQASAEFGIPPAEWIDVSTGISPWSWPVPPVPESVWQRLPEDGDGLLETAAGYYGCDAAQLLALPGSQHGVRHLPALWPAAPVALPLWGYREHQHAWQLAGHEPVFYRDGAHLRALVAQGAVRHVLVINPNNPSADVLDSKVLRHLADELAESNGQLVVDEAFMDPHPEHSLISSRPANTVILRSLGKFFGLAGIRLGFAVAEPALVARLAQDMNPWAVSHPARWIGGRALADRNWHGAQRRRLEDAAQRWQAVLAALFPELDWRRAAHFISAETEWAEAQGIYRAAARRGLLMRLLGPLEDRGMLRLGLPAPQHWQRALDVLHQSRGNCTNLPVS